MIFHKTLLIVLSFLSISYASTVDGYILDAKTSEPLPNCNIQVQNTLRGAISNNEGYYLKYGKRRGNNASFSVHRV
jgi:hypothetical protein